MSTYFDDLPDVFTETFGQDVTVPALGGGTTTITAIIRTEDGEQSIYDTPTVRGETVMHARTEDVSHMVADDEVTVDGVTYLASPGVDDRKGMTRIPLRLD